MEATESGGRAVYSGLRTTAGRPASFGRGQLVTREHLTAAQRLDDGQLERLGVSRSRLTDAQQRGGAAESWYRVLNGGSNSDAAARRLGIERSERTQIRAMTRRGDWSGLQDQYGERFARDTGLAPSAIGEMGRSSLLTRRDLRRDFQSRYRRMHGEAFNPRRRNPERMAATAREVADAHPELHDVAGQMGGSYSSLGHYLGRGDSAENLHGWYTRAVDRSLGGEGQTDQLLRRLDPVTTEGRHVRNFMRARAAVSRSGMSGSARDEAIGRIARQYHGSPGAAQARFFERGRPRAQSPGDVDRLLQEMLTNDRRRQSDEAFLRRLRR